MRGVVFKADNAGALIDIGAKAPALLPLAEASLLRVKNMEDIGLVAGMEEEFSIVAEDDSQGRFILSLKKLQLDLAWERCRQLLTDDVPVRGTVSGRLTREDDSTERQLKQRRWRTRDVRARPLAEC